MATKAIYQHHERTTLAAVVADLQEREVGLDGATGYVVGYNATLAAAFYIPSAVAAITVSTIVRVNSSGRLANSSITDNGTTITHTVAAVFNSTISRVGDDVFTADHHIFRADTTDGADNKRISINGGGSGSATRGGRIVIRGNEYATLGGYVEIVAGGIAGSKISLSGSVIVDSLLEVTGVATFTVQPIFTALTASRAVFTDGSKGLVSNAITGTGNVVMSASPTLTGTAIIAAVTASDQFKGTKTGGGTSSAFLASSGDPSFGLERTDAATNEKVWGMQATTVSLLFMTKTDANGAGVTFMTFNRGTGTAMTSVQYATPLLTLASATGACGFNIPHGAAPSSPVDGDVWTTTAGMFVQINGVSKTVTLL